MKKLLIFPLECVAEFAQRHDTIQKVWWLPGWLANAIMLSCWYIAHVIQKFPGEQYSSAPGFRYGIDF